MTDAEFAKIKGIAISVMEDLSAMCEAQKNMLEGMKTLDAAMIGASANCFMARGDSIKEKMGSLVEMEVDK